MSMLTAFGESGAVFDLRKRKIRGQTGVMGTTTQTYMFAVAAFFILAYLIYARWAVDRLKEYEQEASGIYAKAYAWVVNKAVVDEGVMDDQDMFIWDEVVQKVLFPVILTDVKGNLRAWKGTRIDPSDDPEEQKRRLRELVGKMDKAHRPIPIRISLSNKELISPDTPVVQDGDYILIGHLHYGESSMINRLTWMPYIELLGIGFLVLIGWLGFRNIKNSEQRHIWVGIARETAHQLGTPISSLLGWLELVRSHLGGNGKRKVEESAGELWHVLGEMESDAQRLSRIASRFSQIGSVPELNNENVSEIVAETIQYFGKRLPHLDRDIQVSEHYGNVPKVPVNKDLLGWAIENLLKNAVDAIDHKGGLIVVSVRKSSDGKYVNVFITDNGRGIDSKSRRRVFGPGYTTKQRGWGIGLNFVKRIVEGYHGGKVVLQETAPGEGTTVKVALPIREKAVHKRGPEPCQSQSKEVRAARR